MSDKTIKILSTFFYIGYFPVAPGTMASAAGALIACMLAEHTFIYIILLMAITYFGFQVCGEMEKVSGHKDPSCVVIDEVIGVMISFFLLPQTPAVIITAFFLFRAFDMFKIYPANKIEELGGANGIILDDVVAGIYTNIIMQIAVHFSGVGQYYS